MTTILIEAEEGNIGDVYAVEGGVDELISYLNACYENRIREAVFEEDERYYEEQLETLIKMVEPHKGETGEFLFDDIYPERILIIFEDKHERRW